MESEISIKTNFALISYPSSHASHMAFSLVKCLEVVKEYDDTLTIVNKFEC